MKGKAQILRFTLIENKYSNSQRILILIFKNYQIILNSLLQCKSSSQI